MMKRSTIMVLVLSSMVLTACQGAFDPWQRPGNWVTTGAAQEDVAQQAMYKGELIKGSGIATSAGTYAASGIQSDTKVIPAGQ
jgi:hypothetical protein